MLSSGFFVAGMTLLLASFGLWQMGRTVIARAYVVPMLPAGGLLAIVEVGLFLSGETVEVRCGALGGRNSSVSAISDIGRLWLREPLY